MGQRNVYIPDNMQALLENEARLDAANSQGRLIVALARSALLRTKPPETTTGIVLGAMFDRKNTVAEIADTAVLPRRVVLQTLLLLLDVNAVKRHEDGTWSCVMGGVKL